MRIAWLELPAALDQARLPMPPATADFLQVAQLSTLVTSLFWGTNDFYVSPGHQLAGAVDWAERPTRYAVARQDHPGQDADRILGFAALTLPTEPDGTEVGIAEVRVVVHPEFRRRGIGTALLATAEAEAARAGRTVLQSWADHALMDPGAIGSGPVFARGTSLETGTTPVVTGHTPAPRVQAAEAFARARGYAEAQREHVSVLDLTTAAAAAQRIVASRGGGPGLEGIEMVGWVGPCPDRLAPSMAELLGRMSTDAPAGRAERTPERWDVARLRSEDATRERMGLRMVTTAAVVAGSDRVVGHSDLETYAEMPHVAYQSNTLVDPGFRGRGLSTVLKAANVSRLLAEQPAAERLYTWNAAENAAILAANTALGFVRVASVVCWQKRT